MLLTEIDHVAIAVQDLEAAVESRHRVLRYAQLRVSCEGDG